MHAAHACEGRSTLCSTDERRGTCISALVKQHAQLAARALDWHALPCSGRGHSMMRSAGRQPPCALGHPLFVRSLTHCHRRQGAGEGKGAQERLRMHHLLARGAAVMGVASAGLLSMRPTVPAAVQRQWRLAGHACGRREVPEHAVPAADTASLQPAPLALRPWGYAVLHTAHERRQHSQRRVTGVATAAASASICT